MTATIQEWTGSIFTAASIAAAFAMAIAAC